MGQVAPGSATVAPPIVAPATVVPATGFPARGPRRSAWSTVRILGAALALVPAACATSSPKAPSSAAPPPAVQRRQASFGGTTRTYRVFAPPTLDRERPSPLVLVLGGVGDGADSMTNATQFDREAAAGRFVVAYAEASRPSWSAGFCCAGVDSDAVDDVGFLDHLIGQLEADYRIDAGRVYAVGVSAGAMMAYRMGCEDAARIAGVGSVAGAMLFAGCHPARPVSVIEIHGTADPLVPYTGGAVSPPGVATQTVPSSAALADQWASLDGCPAPPVVEARSPVTTTTWNGCAGGSGVRLVAIEGGGHTWYAPGFGATDGAVDASHAIWTYLSGLRRSP